MEGSCENTTLDSFTYTLDTPENCVIKKVLKQDAKTLHCHLTTDHKKNQFFFLGVFNDTGKGMNVKFKVSPES